jgi:2-iminobutanoate/2-iminopropanoate deaminase
MLKTIETSAAPLPIGPYAQAVSVGQLIYTSGQIPIDPATGDLCGTTIKAQTRQVLANLAAVLAAAGSAPEHVVKSTIFLVNLGDFATVNQIYGDYFGSHRPARSTVQVAALPKGSLIEIELVAVQTEN